MVTVPQVILVPTDYGEFATAALLEAALIARAAHGGIVLMHASVAPNRADLEAYAMQHIPADVAFSLRITNEPPSIAIVRSADALSADLIVMGAQGGSYVEQVVPGSVTVAVQEATSRPVMTVGKLSHQPRPIGRILAGIDFSDTSRRAFDEAKMLATLMNARLTTVHVVRPGSATEDYTATAMDAWLPPVVPTDPPMDRIILHGDPSTLLVHLSKSGEYDLVVLGGGGRITGWVTRQAQCPVLSVPAKPASDFMWNGSVPRTADQRIRN